jgi:DNA-binding MarR family transcriptional regulator
MTNRLDRLESRGLVRRRPDPSDGRGVRVRLTVRGRTRVDRAMADLVARERELLAGLGEKDRHRLAGLLREVLLRFEGTDPSRSMNGR